MQINGRSLYITYTYTDYISDNLGEDSIYLQFICFLVLVVLVFLGICKFRQKNLC